MSSWIISVVFATLFFQVAQSLNCVNCNSQVDRWCPFLDNSVTRQCDIGQSSCVTITHLNGEVSRGCLFDETSQCSDVQSCTICNFDLCNSDQPVPTRCVVCDSRVHSVGCATAVDMSFSLECPNSIQAKTGCYTWKNPENDLVERGCLATLLEPENLSTCEGGEICKICQGDNCNRKGEETVFCSCSF